MKVFPGGRSSDELLVDLEYFCEWGGKTWEQFVQVALQDFLEYDISEKQILEIGYRYGKMSALFALLGGIVTGVDTDPRNVTVAETEARKWGVSNRIKFMAYDGNLNIFSDESFDIIFTKSVLVLVNKLEAFLNDISKKLKSGGKFVFIENGYGNIIIHLLRHFRHRKWDDYHTTSFFTDRDLHLIQNIFEVKLLQRKYFPPVYLICGNKKAH